MNNSSPFESQLHAFFQAMFAYLRRELAGKVSAERIDAAAREVLDHLRSSLKPGSWDTAAMVPIAQAKREANLLRTMRLHGHIVELTEPELVEVIKPSDSEGGPARTEAMIIRIQDRAGDSISSLDVLGAPLIDKIEHLHKRSLPVDVLGMPVVVGRLPGFGDIRPDGRAVMERGSFVFFVMDVEPSRSALDLVAASREERQMVEEWLASFPQRLPLDDMRDELIDQLGIVGTDDFPLLRDLIEFTVLQALSCGRIGHASGRLHLLLAGPPGQGKKLVGLAAKALNPACSELSASKVSVAGLVGASHPTGSGWKSTPGLFARAADGVAVLQDAHGWSEAVVRNIGPVLQEVIEDGVVRDAVAGGQMREAPVSLTIDLNRTSQLDTASRRPRAEAPILRLRPLLSRVDVIAEMPADVGRAWKVAGNMYRRMKVGPGEPDESFWIRSLRLLVAHLRDKHPEIDLDPVRGLMEKVHEELRQSNETAFAFMPEAGDLPTRLAISFGRLVASSARGSDRGVANESDVNRALKFLNLKLSFLRLHGARLVQMSDSPGDRDRRDEWVRHRAGTVVRADDLAGEYEQDTGEKVSERTMRRTIRQLGGKAAGKGMWRLPPTAG